MYSNGKPAADSHFNHPLVVTIILTTKRDVKPLNRKKTGPGPVLHHF